LHPPRRPARALLFRRAAERVAEAADGADEARPALVVVQHHADLGDHAPEAGVGNERLGPEPVLKLRSGHDLGTPLPQGPQALEGLGRKAAGPARASQLAASWVEHELAESHAHGFTQPSRKPNATKTMALPSAPTF
jgi:hypothetical protein